MSLKTRKFISVLLLSVMFCFVGTVFVPEVAYAKQISTEDSQSTESTESTEANDLNAVGVEMGEEGTLKVTGIADGNATDTWNTIFNKSKVFLIGCSGIATLVFVGFFIKNLVSLGAASNNPTARSQALIGCLWTGIAAAGCGSVTLLVGLFWNALK